MSRILTLDIENMALLGWAWGIYETNIISVAHPQHLLTIAWKWLGEKKVYAVSLLDNPKYKKEPHNDRVIAEVIWKILDECDVLVGHNIDRFDNRMMNSMFMRHGMTPPSPYKTVDTLKIARSKGLFVSNKLDDLGDYLGIGRKIKHEGFQMWLDCDSGNEKAYKNMIKYNKQDVVLTEELYLKLLPWASNPPSMSVLDDKPDSCPRCGSLNLNNRGFSATKTSLHQRFVCRDCGGWSSYRLSEKINKPLYVSR